LHTGVLLKARFLFMSIHEKEEYFFEINYAAKYGFNVVNVVK